jgi:triacylglycerol lipase
MTALLAVLALGAAALWLATVVWPVHAYRIGVRAERALAGLATKSAVVDGLAMPYLDGGRGEPLVLIHGFAGDKDNFTRLARFVTPHYRVIVPDLPGFGDASRSDDADHSMSAQANRVAALMRQLGIERAHIGGNSMGGFIACELAAQHPGMVASVWLLDAAGTEASHDTPILHTYLETGSMPLLVREEGDFETLLAKTMHKRAWLPGFAVKALARRAVADYAFHRKLFDQLHASPLLEQRYATIDKPCLVTWGEQDELLNPRGIEAFARLFPGAQRHLMPGLGHLPMCEDPKATARAYLAFRRSFKD